MPEEAVDFLCLVEDVTWLIEVKDYRQHPRKKSGDLGDEVAVKTRDTLSGLATAYANAGDGAEKDFARRAVEAGAWRIALHQPDEDTRLRPKAIDPANVRLKLCQILKAVDPAPVVMDMGTQASVPWSVRRAQIIQRDE